MTYDVITPTEKFKHFPNEQLVRVYDLDDNLLHEVPVSPDFGQESTPPHEEIPVEVRINNLEQTVDNLIIEVLS